MSSRSGDGARGLRGRAGSPASRRAWSRERARSPWTPSAWSRAHASRPSAVSRSASTSSWPCFESIGPASSAGGHTPCWQRRWARPPERACTAPSRAGRRGARPRPGPRATRDRMPASSAATTAGSVPGVGFESGWKMSPSSVSSFAAMPAPSLVGHHPERAGRGAPRGSHLGLDRWSTRTCLSRLPLTPTTPTSRREPHATRSSETEAETTVALLVRRAIRERRTLPSTGSAYAIACVLAQGTTVAVSAYRPRQRAR